MQLGKGGGELLDDGTWNRTGKLPLPSPWITLKPLSPPETMSSEPLPLISATITSLFFSLGPASKARYIAEGTALTWTVTLFTDLLGVKTVGRPE